MANIFYIFSCRFVRELKTSRKTKTHDFVPFFIPRFLYLFTGTFRIEIIKRIMNEASSCFRKQSLTSLTGELFPSWYTGDRAHNSTHSINAILSFFRDFTLHFIPISSIMLLCFFFHHSCDTEHHYIWNSQLGTSKIVLSSDFKTVKERKKNEIT